MQLKFQSTKVPALGTRTNCWHNTTFSNHRNMYVKALIITAALLLGSLADSTAAWARRQSGRYIPHVQQLELNFGRHGFQTRDIVPLRQLLQQQYPRLRLNEWNLERVDVLAKSQFGLGKMSLRVGHWEAFWQNIPGTPRQYDRPGPRTFSWVSFVAPGQFDGGAWQLLNQGNIRVSRIIITLSPQAGWRSPRW